MSDLELQCRFLAEGLDVSDVQALCSITGDAPDGQGPVIKSDRTTTVFRAAIGNLETVVKRYNTKNRWHALRRNFQPSRADNSLRATAQFRRSGLLAPRSLAVVEQSYGPFAGVSWFFSEYLDLPTLLDYLNTQQSEHQINAVMMGVTDIFATMQQDGLSHGDMKASNILVDDVDGLLRLFLIDFDAAERHKNRANHRKALSKDCHRFLKNWRDIPQLESRFSEIFDQLKIQ